MSALPVHAQSGGAVVAALASDGERGLSPAAARQRLEQQGPNRLRPARGTPVGLRLLRQLHNPLLITLLLVGGVKLVLGHPRDAAVIGSVTLINAVIGTVQESRAERAIAALAAVVRTEVEVIRGGVRQRLPSEELVVGDLVTLAAGARVPADLRLLTVRDLRTDESSLTGESLPVAKGATAVEATAPLAERIGMAYAGTSVTAGQGTGLVVATGEDTEVGRIATALQQPVSLSTPLMRRFQRFSRTLLQLVLVLAGLTFAVGLLRGRSVDEMFDGAVALAVGAIPEELPAMVTITLAIGVHRMARRRAIIRRLPAVETLGSTTVICSDKTGTLTQNRMTVRQLYGGGALVAIEELWPGNGGEANVALQETLLAGLLCNDARPGSRHDHVGDPTETALLVAADAAGLNRHEALRRHPRRDAIPFASEQQFMATLHGRERILVKGAVEAVLARCDGQLDAAGRPQALNRPAIEAAVRAMAVRGERVLAFAIGRADPDAERLEHRHVAGHLRFVGLQGMVDPPRPEAIGAVAACRRAGIRVVMITGDHVDTARAIARQLGIGCADGALTPEAVDGARLASASAAALARLVRRVDVFARVAPAQKLALVEALQAQGAVVAMTGDGVNDAPALRQADIGIAMGAGGTEVARQAADMLLTDDNFATIAAAVEEGRHVALNLRKMLAFVLPVNGGASMTILLAALLGLPLPVTALQVLWLNMVCSLTMSLALAFEPLEAGLMELPPRPAALPLLHGGLLRRLLVVSLFNWAVIFGLFFWCVRQQGDLALARTLAVQGLVLAHLVYLGTISQRRWNVALGLLGTVVVQALFSQAGWMNRFFGTAPLAAEQLVWCLVPMVLMLPVAAVAERLDPLSGWWSGRRR
ncbi:MAG: HAD-IC family P-type ATPase [Cyanobacteriota bacterium]|nr:HAD-IC family P-type ATPase [Cyanobacteriota bacterium]